MTDDAIRPDHLQVSLTLSTIWPVSIKVVCTPYGPPATERLGEQITALKNGNPLAPVTVVVPTNIAGLATRRALGAQRQGVAAVSFLKLFDLAERLAGQQMADEHQRRPLSEPIISATVRKVLNANAGLFHASAHHPATEQALVRSYRDLRDLSDQGLDLLAAQSNRAADVVRICRQATEELQDRWFDGQDLNDLAIEALRSGSIDGIVDEFGPIVVLLPQRVTRSQGLLVTILAESTPVVVLVALTGDEKADAPVLESVRRMGGELDAIPPAPKAHGQRIVSTASADEEVGVAVREVMNAIRDGIQLGRIAVLCGNPAVIRQLHEQLDAADILYNGPSGRTLADSLVGRGLLALLDLENRDFRRDEVFALLSVASIVLPNPEARGEPRPPATAPAIAWERVSRRAGVARGAGQWMARLGKHASDLRGEAEKERADPDHSEYRVERLLRDANHADSLAQFMAGLISDLSPDPAPATWSDWCRWIRGLIDAYLGDEQSQQDWPDQEREAADSIDGILKRLATLDRIEPYPRPTTFRHTLASELSTPTKREGRVGQGVLTGRIGDSLGMELDLTILIGMAEGVFPHSPQDDPLLPDRERKAVGDDLTLLSDRLDEQHRHFLAALASTQTNTLIYARGDSRRSAEQHPSRWLLETASALASRPVDSTNLESLADDETADWFEHVSSFSGRVVDAEFPATAQELRLQFLAQADRPEDLPLVEDLVLARGAKLAAARASDQFTRFDGNLSDVDIADLTGSVMSPTSLETWADCPMRFLFRHVLRVQTVDQPEELLEISALEKGSLVHSALDLFMREQMEQGQIPPPSRPWSKQQQNRLRGIGQELCEEAEDQGLTGAPVYWRHDRDRILADLDRFLHEDNEQRRLQGTTPIASELAFGMPDDELGAVAVTLPSGRQVRFRGRADRVDQGRNGSLAVTDYKTGRSDDFKKLDQGAQDDDWDPVQRGTRLQLPVYGLAARAQTGNTDASVTAQYWFVTSDQDFKRYGYVLDDGVLRRFQDVVATIAENIEAGVFCDRPQPGRTEGRFSQYCDYCNADRLGTQDRRRDWERKHGQSELAGYRNLAEPPANDPDGEAG